ncbi:MAG: FG-GAP-like repeat-containing protein [Ignavibacteria bacterium]
MKVYFTLIALLFLNTSYSQQLVQKFDGINFNINGVNSIAPFNGGNNNARFQFVDIDGDQCLDLFIYDTDTSLYYYKNIGTPQNASYKLISTRYDDLYFHNWFYFADMDNDNDYDLFTGGEFQTVKYYRNTGTVTNPSFTLIINELRTHTDTTIYSEANCVPIFCDIDNDGDKDFFTGQSLGTITYYENIGTPTNFSFQFITDVWQDLIIISPALSYQKNLNIDGNRHGANSLEFADIDNDNDFDLFWGDLFSKGIYFIKNNGTPSNPNVAIVDSTYPHNSPYISHGYNSTRFVDIDNDGDKDLFISVLYLSQNNNNFAFYKNNGTATVPDYELQSNNYLNNVDVGGNSNITFADIDNDNDKDLFIGSDFSKISLYRNTGTATSPSFNLEIDSLPLLSASFNYAPAFADLDNDGDEDLLLGSYIRDSLWFYRNTGTATDFNFTLEARGHQIGLTTLGQSSTPVFADIDNDGDKDLFLGSSNGRILYYENTGTASNFNFTFVTNFYYSIDVGDESIPRFFDIDSDGDLDLFIGRQDGRISYYKNVGSVTDPEFELETNEYKNINVHSNSCPEFTDIDNDTDLDLFIGNIKGGLYYFRNDDIVGIKNISGEIPAGYKLHQNYPNPFNPSTKIRFDIPQNAYTKLSVFDISGKELSVLADETLSAGSYEYTWNANNFSSGVYFYRLITGDHTENKSMLYLK